MNSLHKAALPPQDLQSLKAPVLPACRITVRALNTQKKLGSHEAAMKPQDRNGMDTQQLRKMKQRGSHQQQLPEPFRKHQRLTKLIPNAGKSAATGNVCAARPRKHGVRKRIELRRHAQEPDKEIGLFEGRFFDAAVGRVLPVQASRLGHTVLIRTLLCSPGQQHKLAPRKSRDKSITWRGAKLTANISTEKPPSAKPAKHRAPTCDTRHPSPALQVHGGPWRRPRCISLLHFSLLAMLGAHCTCRHRSCPGRYAQKLETLCRLCHQTQTNTDTHTHTQTTFGIEFIVQIHDVKMCSTLGNAVRAIS